MPAKSKSQQRLFGMVHAYQKGELKNVSKNIEEIAAHISEEDAEHFAKTKHKKLPEKKAGIELREGPYDDVKKVYDALTPEEKNFVTPGRTFYKDVPYTSRRVAYDGSVPIGFADLYGLYEDGSPRTSQILALAVSDAARGRRVARSMVDEVIEAAVARARQNKNRRTKVKRIIWYLLKDNEASARAAANSGFTERLYDKPRSYRRFVKDLTEKKAHTQGGHDVTYISKIAAIAALAASPATPAAATAKPAASPQARPVVRTVAKPVAKPAPAVKTPAKPGPVYPTTGPVGYRNNNPGNLRSDGRTRWQGAASVPAKGEWLKFNTYDDGVRAMARTLYNYGKKHKIDTVEGALKRYDRSPDQTNYLAHVRSKMGLKPDQKIDLTDVNTLHKLVPAMGSFEIGPEYWGKYNASSISNAVQRAIPAQPIKAK